MIFISARGVVLVHRQRAEHIARALGAPPPDAAVPEPALALPVRTPSQPASPRVAARTRCLGSSVLARVKRLSTLNCASIRFSHEASVGVHTGSMRSRQQQGQEAGVIMDVVQVIHDHEETLARIAGAEPTERVLRLNPIHPTWRLSETLGWQRVVDETALPAWRRCVSHLPRRPREESVGGEARRWTSSVINQALLGYQPSVKGT